MRKQNIDDVIDCLKETKSVFVALDGMCKGVCDNIDEAITALETRRDIIIASAYALDILIEKLQSDEVTE